MTARRAVRYGSLLYLAAILVAPVGLIFYRAFEHGFGVFWDAISNPVAVHALKLTVEVAIVAVPLNTVFGILCALAIVRHRIPGMGLVNAVVDLPMALSPVVVGLALYLLYGTQGWFGPWLTSHGHRILFAYPGILLATTFVSLPFVVREVVPVLREIGIEQEEAAATLGAPALATFFRITLPSIRYAVAYGVVLTTARCLGEFGAVAIVSGGIENRTQTFTQYVQASYENFQQTNAYAASVVLAGLAVATLVAMTLFRPREDIRGDRNA
ncbi:MAG TPA: sulfate ABC transporter permease subunit [Gaiellaceae bacterium]|nr:sulfate ABC transporter permease subunit [Gaiellaceae bacterium]